MITEVARERRRARQQQHAVIFAPSRRRPGEGRLSGPGRDARCAVIVAPGLAKTRVLVCPVHLFSCPLRVRTKGTLASCHFRRRWGHVGGVPGASRHGEVAPLGKDTLASSRVWGRFGLDFGVSIIGAVPAAPRRRVLCHVLWVGLRPLLTNEELVRGRPRAPGYPARPVLAQSRKFIPYRSRGEVAGREKGYPRRPLYGPLYACLTSEGSYRQYQVALEM